MGKAALNVQGCNSREVVLTAARLKPTLQLDFLAIYERGYFPMAKKETASPAIPVFPMLKTVEQMSKISGIGENKLRELMDSGELEYIQNGNRRLIADAAIWDWYHRAKTTAKPPARQGG